MKQKRIAKRKGIVSKSQGKASVARPRTIAELKRRDAKQYEYFLYCRLKHGVTFQEYLNEYYKR